MAKTYTCKLCGKTKKDSLFKSSPVFFKDAQAFVCNDCLTAGIKEAPTNYSEIAYKHAKRNLQDVNGIQSYVPDDLSFDQFIRIRSNPDNALDILRETINIVLYDPNNVHKVGTEPTVFNMDLHTIKLEHRYGMFKDKYEFLTFDFSQIVSYEYFENSESISKGGSGVGKAIIGGALFGTAGAVIGSAMGGKRYIDTNVRDMKIMVTIDEGNNNFQVYEIIFAENADFLNRDSERYKNKYTEVLQAMALLDKAYELGHPQEVRTVTQEEDGVQDASKKLREMKALLDEGVLTQEDFDAVKKQILGI